MRYKLATAIKKSELWDI